VSHTSTTHPLRIDSLPLENGQIGLTLCPGKQGDSVFGATWARDLALDLDAVASWGADMVLSLLDDHEFDMLAVRGLGEGLKVRGMGLHFPICDVDVPAANSAGLWRGLSRRIHDRLERGSKVLIHCRDDRGPADDRTGRESAARAIAEVRSVRPGAVETRVGSGQWAERQCQDLAGLSAGGAMGDSLGATSNSTLWRPSRRVFRRGSPTCRPMADSGARSPMTRR